MNGTVRRQWKMPNEKPVWAGCWTAANKVNISKIKNEIGHSSNASVILQVVLGLGDGRVYEYSVDSDSTEPVRDYTQGVGNLPIIFTGYVFVSFKCVFFIHLLTI